MRPSLSKPTGPKARERRVMFTPLEWPHPHRMNIVPSDADGHPERCAITLHDGTEIQGVVCKLDFEAGDLSFQLDTGETKKVAFASIRSLRLLRPVELENAPLPGVPGSYESRTRAPRDACRISFKTGPALHLPAASVVCRKPGLFVFALLHGDWYTRWFFPVQAIASEQVAA